MTSVDFSPEVTALQHDGVKIVYVIEGGQGIVGALQAAGNIGYQPYWALRQFALDPVVLSAIPSTATHVVMVVPYLYTATTTAPIRSAMNKYFGTGLWRMSFNTLNSWESAAVFSKALSTIKGPRTVSPFSVR